MAAFSAFYPRRSVFRHLNFLWYEFRLIKVCEGNFLRAALFYGSWVMLNDLFSPFQKGVYYLWNLVGIMAWNYVCVTSWWRWWTWRNGISWRATKREYFWKISMALLSEEFLKSSVMLVGYSEMSFVWNSNKKIKNKIH